MYKIPQATRPPAICEAFERTAKNGKADRRPAERKKAASRFSTGVENRWQASTPACGRRRYECFLFCITAREPNDAEARKYLQ